MFFSLLWLLLLMTFCFVSSLIRTPPKNKNKIKFSSLIFVNNAGVRSFDFLGLGYRVNWPLSIVLTPAALKIYADIFSFLIQVKLAIFSLTDVWCSLKVWFLAIDSFFSFRVVYYYSPAFLFLLSSKYCKLNFWLWYT